MRLGDACRQLGKFPEKTRHDHPSHLFLDRLPKGESREIPDLDEGLFREVRADLLGKFFTLPARCKHKCRDVPGQGDIDRLGDAGPVSGCAERNDYAFCSQYGKAAQYPQPSVQCLFCENFSIGNGDGDIHSRIAPSVMF